MTQILNAIYEPMFKNFSYGFRPGRNCHQAIAYLDKMIHREKVEYVVDLDIKGFFDNIDHEWLIKFLEYRIKDKVYIRYIRRFLKSGILEQGKRLETEKGTPQGGIISPVLGNIYLHFVLDDWFEKVVEKQCEGYSGIVRYADDVVACFQYKEEAEKFLRSVKQRLKQFNLEVSETIKLLNIKLMGNYRYYGITDNIFEMRKYREIVIKMLLKILNRRSQKGKLTYEEFYEKVEKKIIRPKIYVDIVKMSYTM